MKKEKALQELKEECTHYFDELYAPEKKVYVFGDGDPQAKIVLVGEAPGEQESLMGIPFVGKAGKNLDEFLIMTGLTRAQLYITNVVKFRPVRLSEKGRASNRAPTREEVQLWTPWLKRELETISPDCIVTLGNVPLCAVSGQRLTVGKAHGQYASSCIVDSKLFCLYHPASVIYNRSLVEPYIQDVLHFSHVQLERENGQLV